MSLNIYLKPDVAKEKGFDELPHMAFSTLKGITIHKVEGRLVAHSSVDREIPEVLRPYVDELSVKETLQAYSTREAGEYEHKSVKAVVERVWCGPGGTSQAYEVLFTVTELADAREFLKLFRYGNILPVPGRSYHQPQISDGKSYAELEAEVERLKASEKRLNADIARLNDQNTRLLEKVAQAIRELQSFMDELGWWSSWKFRNQVEGIRTRLIIV